MTHGAYISPIISTTKSGTPATSTCRRECTGLVALYFIEKLHVRHNVAASGANYVWFSCKIIRPSFTILHIHPSLPSALQLRVSFVLLNNQPPFLFVLHLFRP
jgi:hypothetical protein